MSGVLISGGLGEGKRYFAPFDCDWLCLPIQYYHYDTDVFGFFYPFFHHLLPKAITIFPST